MMKCWGNNGFSKVLIMVLVECPNCKEKFDVDLSFRKGYRNCPNCGEKLVISGFEKKCVRMLNEKSYFEKIFRKRDKK